MSRCLLLSILVVVFMSPPVPAFAEEPDADASSSESPFIRNIEWFGMSLGGGFLVYEIEESYFEATVGRHLNPMLTVSFNLINLNYKNFYCTVLEVHPTFYVGYIGIGGRLGGRIPLDPAFKEEIRLGSFIGMDTFFTGPGLPVTFTLCPHFRYVYNTDIGSLGFGIDFPINILDDPDNFESGDGHYDKAKPVAGGALLYFHFTAGRTGI